MKCPICGTPVEAGIGDFPFCSERCRLVDLGNWASEKYVIPAPLEPDEEEVPPDASTRVALALATWFGCGYAPVAPGTAGSLAALAIAFALHTWLGWGTALIGLLGVLIIAPGMWAGSIAAKHAGRKDPGLVVIDEVAGQWITFLGATTLTWKSWLFGFLLFRFFDIVKPPPARQLEALPGGIGIMADDVMAGIYGALALYYIGYFGLY